MRCASCGTENRPGSRFCDNCGAQLAVACAACGEPNRADARFCAICGAALGADAADAAGAAAPEIAPNPAPGAERRLVTVLFCDLVGFTTYAEDRDPEHVRDLLNRYFATATDVVTRHGGTVEKFIGDAVMAMWGAPVAHEDDAERAVRAGLEIIDAVRGLGAGLEARVGVLTGEAAVTVGAQNQGMVAGDLVNTAARLQGVAEPGTVLVGEATMRAASGAVVFEPIGDHSLKGKTAPVPAWQAVRVVAARGGQGRADTLEPPFVGRDEELRQLKELLHAVGRERRVRLVSITGPGGIGKSRLVWELEKYIDGVTEDIWWHRGRSPSYGEGISFWALGEMVRRRARLAEDDDEATTRQRIEATVAEFVADPEERERIGPALLSLLGVEPAPAAGRDALFPAWRLFFERIAERGTTVLVFEDLQWADAGLLDFIDHLLDWTRALPIMVVTLARPELIDRRPDWATGRRHLSALALEPLSDAAMTELLAGLVPGLPDAVVATIVQRADGVPLYAVETVRALLTDGRVERVGDTYLPVGDLSALSVPESLRSLIASRLDGLDPADRKLLQGAAVLGQVFSAEVLAATSGVDAGALEPRLRGLIRREILDLETDPSSPERGQYRFVQSLIREIAYGTLSRRDRRSHHLAVARHYEGAGDEEMAGALASHYVAAHAASDEGPEANAVAVQARLALVAAADRAASLGSPDQALAFGEQALTLTAEASDRAPVLDRMTMWAAAASREAERYGTGAIESYRELGDAVAAVRAAARLGRALVDTQALTRAQEHMEATLPEAEAVGDDAALADVLAQFARVCMRTGDAARSIEMADRALDIAERLNLEDTVAEALLNKASSLMILGRRRESIALHVAALDLSIQLGDRSREMRARNNLASSLSEDDPGRALEMVLEALELAREVGDRGMFNWLAGFAAVFLVDQGREWDAHLEVLRQAHDTALIASDRARLVTLAGLIEMSRGERIDEIKAEIEELVGQSEQSEDRLAYLLTASSAALLTGDPATAYGHGMTAARLETQNPELGLDLALIAAAWGRDLEGAREAAAAYVALPQSGGFSVSQRERAAGMVALLEGRLDEGVAAYRSAIAWHREHGMHFAVARLVVEAAVMRPDHPEIRAWAAESRPVLEELRARPYLERLDAALASAPSTAVTPTAEGVTAGR